MCLWRTCFDLNYPNFIQDEVDQWEDKVKSLKEELSQLETQKKGLEAILRKHAGSCKVVKSGSV